MTHQLVSLAESVHFSGRPFVQVVRNEKKRFLRLALVVGVEEIFQYVQLKEAVGLMPKIEVQRSPHVQVSTF